MKRGYSQQITYENVTELISTGVDEESALAVATSHARGIFKHDNPESVNFPKHLMPGKVKYAYQQYKDGEASGEEEK